MQFSNASQRLIKIFRVAKSVVSSHLDSIDPLNILMTPILLYETIT